jgi:hypothetical protein
MWWRAAQLGERQALIEATMQAACELLDEATFRLQRQHGLGLPNVDAGSGVGNAWRTEMHRD